MKQDHNCLMDIKAIRKYLSHIVVQYEITAPTVSRWADDLYIRLNEDLYNVRVIEIVQAQLLLEEGAWEHPNFAANKIYKLMHELGQDTTGHAGY